MTVANKASISIYMTAETNSHLQDSSKRIVALPEREEADDGGQHGIKQQFRDSNSSFSEFTLLLVPHTANAKKPMTAASTAALAHSAVCTLVKSASKPSSAGPNIRPACRASGSDACSHSEKVTVG